MCAYACAPTTTILHKNITLACTSSEHSGLSLERGSLCSGIFLGPFPLLLFLPDLVGKLIVLG